MRNEKYRISEIPDLVSLSPESALALEEVGQLSQGSRTLGRHGRLSGERKHVLLGEDSCWPAVFTGLAAALGNPGINAEVHVPAYTLRPRGSGYKFEEKLIPSMTGFSALCGAELSASDADVFDWNLLVPLDFEGALELQVPSSYIWPPLPEA